MNPREDSAAMWGGPGRSRNAPSLLEMVRNNTMDLALASTLWLLVERKASFIVAAGPQLAGKTTVLMALMDLAPPEHRKVRMLGVAEDFGFVSETKPSETYLMVAELSDHTPAYMWGDGARRLFELAVDGYSIAATMHADSPEEVSAMLSEPPVSLTAEQAAALDAVVNLLSIRGAQGTLRRVSALSVAGPADSSGRLSYVRLARWDPAEDSFRRDESPTARSALAARVGMTPAEVEVDLEGRARVLGSWLEGESIDSEAVRRLAGSYYEGRSTPG